MIKTNELVKVFRTDEVETTALNKVNLNIESGEFVAIMGPSGCGKSTLLNLIAGFDNYDSGQIKLKGKRISKPEPNRIMVFQDFNQLFPWKTIIENVIFPLKVNRKKILKIKKIIGYNN